MNNIIDLLAYEKTILSNGIELIAGVDEVGRGALAGPMVVSAVIINPKHLIEYTKYSKHFALYTKINDSKKIPPKTRREINEFLHNVLLDYSIVEISHLQIDKLGLTACTQLSFYQAIEKLTHKPDRIFTDTFKINKYPEQIQSNIIKGDTKSISIAAASIVAKVFRDDLMIQLHTQEKYAHYAFDKHKGYGTKLHLEMIAKHGLSDIHRKSFKTKKLH